MIQCFCDKCKKQVPRVTRVLEYEYATDVHGVKLIPFTRAAHDLCDKCNEKFERVNLDIAEYMQLSEEEIDLLEYTFKVGDEVITSTGELGVIEDICTCDQCKKRGFYEPQVKTEIGNGTIYITDNDKRANFRSFYKIGDRVFGNLDEDDLLDSIERNQTQIRELNEELDQLIWQRNVIRYYKKNTLKDGDNT